MLTWSQLLSLSQKYQILWILRLKFVSALNIAKPFLTIILELIKLLISESHTVRMVPLFTEIAPNPLLILMEFVGHVLVITNIANFLDFFWNFILFILSFDDRILRDILFVRGFFCLSLISLMRAYFVMALDICTLGLLFSVLLRVLVVGFWLLVNSYSKRVSRGKSTVKIPTLLNTCNIEVWKYFD